MSIPTPKIFETGAMKMEPGLSATGSGINFTADAGTDILTTASDHGYVTGDSVVLTTSGADLPDPLAISTEYFVILVDSDEIQLATTYANAIAGTEINILDAGTGTHTIQKLSLQTDGWGGTSGVQTLGANDAFPWLTFGSKLNVATEEDASVTTRAFKTTPRMIGKTVDNPLSFYNRFKGIGRFFYWMWGFENDVVPVVVCRAGSSPFSSTPTIGDEGDDSAAKSFKFLRKEVTRTEELYIFKVEDGIAPTGTTITKAAGWVFTFTSTSAIMYEHLYELDSQGRRLRPYTAAERAVLTSLLVADYRNLACTLGKRTSGYDLRYKNSICKNFSLKMTAAGLSQWDANYMAFTEERGDYSSSTWTLLSGLGDNSLVPAHFEYRFLIGETIAADSEGAISGLTEIGMSDVSFDVETPLQAIQDTISGLSLAEPVLENKYGVRCTGTISRHTVQTYQTYRDAQTKVVAHLIANQGNYMQEIMMKECTFSEAGGDDSDVMAEPLALECGFIEGTSEWTEFLYGVTELHDSPVLFRVRDDSSQNEMLRY